MAKSTKILENEVKFFYWKNMTMDDRGLRAPGGAGEEGGAPP
jgi:hypothetical protein